MFLRVYVTCFCMIHLIDLRRYFLLSYFALQSRGRISIFGVQTRFIFTVHVGCEVLSILRLVWPLVQQVPFI